MVIYQRVEKIATVENLGTVQIGNCVHQRHCAIRAVFARRKRNAILVRSPLVRVDVTRLLPNMRYADIYRSKEIMLRSHS